MCGNQAKLAKNFDSFINQFAGQAQDIDFKMALISAPKLSEEVNYRVSNFGGRMYYSRYGTTLTASDLKSNEQGFINQFKSIVNQIGCNGHSYHAESGLVMSLDFLEENPNWFRKDAFLLIIHISDEYDDGTLITRQGTVKLVYGFYCARSKYAECTVAGETDDHKVTTHYINTLAAHKSSFLFKIFSVVNHRTTAPRFNQVAELSGGKAYNILKDSFDTILQDFGQKVTEISSLFQLKYPAKASAIEVYVDGSLASQSEWRYLPGKNAISFEKNYTPQAGSQIKVVYEIK